MRTENPMAKAFIHPFTSQIVEVGTAMAAVAWAPSEPTMAESTYVTVTCRTCSRIVGQARDQMMVLGGIERSRRLGWERRLAIERLSF